MSEDVTERCPVCKETSTNRVDLDVLDEIVLEVRSCDSCGSQYEVEFGEPIKRVVEETDV